MYKILEFLYKDAVKPTAGGPWGYVYYLVSGFQSENVELHFLDEESQSSSNSKLHSFKKALPKWLYRMLKIFQQNASTHRFLKGERKLPENINDFDLIHFHSTFDLACHSKELQKFKGIVVLTTHTPCPLFYELKNDYYKPFEKLIGANRICRSEEKLDEIAFDSSDYIIFPCAEAEEPYYKLWSKYKDIHERNKAKYRYILSGAMPKKPRVESDEIRNELHVGSSFLVSFIGRHCFSKGYDLLKKIGNSFLEKDSDSFFVICGSIGPMKPLKNKKWIEIGWTKDADSYINASDVFVLPNRNTYFDLVFLEVLSLGKIIVASKTGGNLFFDRFKNCGIFLYSSEDEAVDYLHRIKEMSLDERKSLEKANYNLYLTYFTPTIFGKNYENFYLRALKK
jgi:glycosyltransferase involved in cell wall biosynthesis